MLNHAQLREKRTPLKRTPLKHCERTRSARGAEALHEHAQARSHAGMYDRQLLARLSGSRSPYGMQHGSERRLLGRLLGPATMNSNKALSACLAPRDVGSERAAGSRSGRVLGRGVEGERGRR